MIIHNEVVGTILNLLTLIAIYNDNKFAELKETAELNAEDIQKDYTGKSAALTVLADKVTEFGKDNLEDVYNSVKTLSEFSFF